VNEELNAARDKLKTLEHAAGRLFAADPELWDTMREIIQDCAMDNDDIADSAYNTMAAIGLVYMTVKLGEKHAEDSVSGYQTGTNCDDVTEDT